MKIYEVWDQWPVFPFASFRTLSDAEAFIKSDGWRLALPIIVGRTV